MVLTLLSSHQQDLLLGDASKAARELGWQPKVSFEVRCLFTRLAACGPLSSCTQDLIKEMVQSDIELLTKDPTA